jgi:hypothetical protein
VIALLVGLERAGRSNRVISSAVFSNLRVLEDAMLRRENAGITALSKEQRRRDCAHRHCRSYRGRAMKRQRFPALPKPAGIRLEMADKVLMRLNFLSHPVNGLTAVWARQG